MAVATMASPNTVPHSRTWPVGGDQDRSLLVAVDQLEEEMRSIGLERQASRTPKL